MKFNRSTQYHFFVVEIFKSLPLAFCSIYHVIVFCGQTVMTPGPSCSLLKLSTV